jgi:hypothetical protein
MTSLSVLHVIHTYINNSKKEMLHVGRVMNHKMYQGQHLFTKYNLREYRHIAQKNQ